MLPRVLLVSALIQTLFATDNSQADDPQVYDFSSPVDLKKLVIADPLFLEIVGTDAFQRLKEIRFLGGIDYLFVPNPNGAPGNTRYTRFQHSVGVARLALMYARACDLSSSDRRLVFTAALLHDIGHAPLSHSLEPVFSQFFDMDHHLATREILRGNVPIGRELYKLLRNHQVDRSIVSGNRWRRNRLPLFFLGPN
jgi:putative nucleotidyltransferase with HDIG domain